MKKDLLKVGDVIDIKKGHRIYADILEVFVYDNVLVSDQYAHTDITVGEMMKSFDTRVFAGRYIVIKTSLSGGGTGMGNYDVYPDGHHVTCMKLLEGDKVSEPTISFYQTGCFTAMIEDIAPVEHLNLVYEMKITRSSKEVKAK